MAAALPKCDAEMWYMRTDRESLRKHVSLVTSLPDIRWRAGEWSGHIKAIRLPPRVSAAMAAFCSEGKKTEAGYVSPRPPLLSSIVIGVRVLIMLRYVP